MTELPVEIEKMLQARKLERVSVNHDHARSVISTAQRHLQTAELLAQTDDIAMAFTAGPQQHRVPRRHPSAGHGTGC